MGDGDGAKIEMDPAMGYSIEIEQTWVMGPEMG